MIALLKTYLAEKLKEKLPGKNAHLEAAPYRRIYFDDLELSEAKASAVLVLFYLKEEVPFIILIQRPKYDGIHSGQIAFPGGKQEDSDLDITQTALREANEEVGIMTDDVEAIGQLTDVYIPVSKFNVTPVIGFINYYPDFVIDSREVDELIELRLSDLTGIKKMETTKIKLADSTILDAPCFVFDGKIIWGATALMLNELRYILKGWKAD